jgi:hypothetical protein
MSSQLDDRIRTMMQHVVNESPPPPDLPTGPPPALVAPQRVPNWAAAVGAAVVVFILIGGAVWLLGGTGSGVIDEPTPVSTTPPTTTAPTPDPDAAPLITIDADQVNYPHPGDETHGVAIADGMLWATTEAGIIRWDLVTANAKMFTPANGLPFAEGASGQLSVAPDGTVWAFTWSKDLAVFDGTRWVEPAGYDQLDIVNPRCTLDEECLDPITAMAVGPDGLLSLAVGPETLLQYNGIDWSVLPVTPAETHGDGASAWATDIAVASDGTLWVASWEEVLAYDGDSWDRFTTDDGLPSGMINSVALAPNGDIWVGTIDDFEGDAASSGVARFDGDTWTVFDETDGLYEDAVTALAIAPDSTVWAVHSGIDALATDTERATGGISRFDGTTWSAATIADLGEGLGWGGAVVDDTGKLWVTSRWGVIGFDGTEATVLRLPAGTRPPVNALPFTLPSQIFPASEDPFEWRWDSLSSETGEATGVQELVRGNNCYGVGGEQRPTAVVEFNDSSIDFSLGYRSTPDIVVTDAAGTVTQVGNPFGELAWLCSIATTDTHILAVGSGVSWSEDGIAWHGIDAFEQFAGSNGDGSELMWAAAGPGGYMVLGREGIVWFSEDLETWHEIHLENDGYGTSVWGWVGPTSISVEEEIVITMFDEGWIGTRRDG